MIYARVENNIIMELYSNLPKAWKNVSNFNFLSREELEPFNFFPVIDVDAYYDKEIYDEVDQRFEFEAKEKVVKKYLILRKKPNKLEGG